jgi:hypothetical protein
MNEARNRIWGDNEAVVTVVTPDSVPDGNVRTSDEAMKILRDDGVAAYERYVAEKSKTN